MRLGLSQSYTASVKAKTGPRAGDPWMLDNELLTISYAKTQGHRRYTLLPTSLSLFTRTHAQLAKHHKLNAMSSTSHCEEGDPKVENVRSLRHGEGRTISDGRRRVPKCIRAQERAG